jgi:hypothetical protein
MFRLLHRTPANLEQPSTFSEKIQQRKLYDRDPRFARLSDKLAVKPYIREKLGPEWLIPTLWDGVPLTLEVLSTLTRPFVVKANHGSGLNLFINAGTGDLATVVAQANGWRNRPVRSNFRNRVGDPADRTILIEPDISLNGAPPEDFKFFTFGGRVRAIQVDSNRFSGHRRDFYTREWQPMDFELEKPRLGAPIEPPQHLDRMIEAAEAIGSEFDFVRVDLYDLPDHPRFGELTFYPGSGFDRFRPTSMDLQFGRWWPER